jgi:hypothetical protein
MTTRRSGPKLEPGVKLSEDALRRLHARRNPEIERQRMANKTFPCNDDPTLKHTGTPADSAHPAHKR